MTQMPDSDPNSGRVFIWLITCVLFISILAGGGCLVAYMTLPESQTSPMLPVLGVTLVCLPWAFWFLTCLYRLFSRCCGLRVGIDNGGGGGYSGGAAAASSRRNQDVEVAAKGKSGHVNRVSSVGSHESEMAFANSMAS